MSLICPHPWMMVWILNSRWILLFFSTLKALLHFQVVFKLLIVKSDAILNLHYHVFPFLWKRSWNVWALFFIPCILAFQITVCVFFFFIYSCITLGMCWALSIWKLRILNSVTFYFYFLIIFLVISFWGYIYVMSLTCMDSLVSLVLCFLFSINFSLIYFLRGFLNFIFQTSIDFNFLLLHF